VRIFSVLALLLGTTLPPVTPPLRVMPLGDSITNGLGSITYAATRAWLDAHPGSETDPDWEETGTDPYNGYRADLKARLDKAGMKIDYVGSRHSGTFGDVEHEGHPGWTIAQINNILAARLDTYRPDVILLHLGTNNSRREAYTLSAPDELRTTMSIIKEHAPAAVVFVAKIVGPARYDADGVARARRVNSLNAVLPGIVAAAGANLVDMSDISGLDLADAVHPNTVGYAKMAWKWYQAIKSVLGRPTWPSAGDPYALTRVDRCISWTAAPFAHYAIGCHTWYRRGTLWQVRAPDRWITGW
jgi:lysophospholipase L1-like esterase